MINNFLKQKRSVFIVVAVSVIFSLILITQYDKVVGEDLGSAKLVEISTESGKVADIENLADEITKKNSVFVLEEGQYKIFLKTESSDEDIITKFEKISASGTSMTVSNSIPVWNTTDMIKIVVAFVVTMIFLFGYSIFTRSELKRIDKFILLIEGKISLVFETTVFVGVILLLGFISQQLINDWAISLFAGFVFYSFLSKVILFFDFSRNYEHIHGEDMLSKIAHMMETNRKSILWMMFFVTILFSSVFLASSILITILTFVALMVSLTFSYISTFYFTPIVIESLRSWANKSSFIKRNRFLNS